MRIDKKALDRTDDVIKVVEAVDPDGTLAEARKNQQQEQEESAASSETEYEYVNLSEVTTGITAKIKEILSEYYVVVGCVAIVIVASIIIALGKTASAAFIAVAFGILAVLGAILIYIAWRDKRAAEKAYKHAVEVMEPVRRKMKTTTEENDKEEK